MPPTDHATSSSDTRDTTSWASRTALQMVDALGSAWAKGWQPRDVDWALGRDDRTTRVVLRRAILAEAATSAGPGRAVPPSWRAQLDAIAAELPAAPDPWAALVAAVASVPVFPCNMLRVGLETLADVPAFTAPPSAWGRAGSGPAPAGEAPTAVLEKVRALLAKAESTEFEAEAAAFTAKAQELITRHSIDVVLIAAGRDGGAGRPPVTGRTVHVEDPYAKEKWFLLSTVAEANGCRTIYSPGYRIVTCFGLPDDLEAVELLYTSLLLQSTTAMLAAGAPRLIGRRSSSAKASFRRSFLLAFSQRIGVRLDEARQAAETQASTDHGRDVLPVLASRDAAVTAAVDEAFPRTRRSRFTVGDAAGAAAGDAAGARASLGEAGAVRPSRRSALRPGR